MPKIELKDLQIKQSVGIGNLKLGVEKVGKDLCIENGTGENSVQSKGCVADQDFAISLGDGNKSHAKKAITLGTQNEITAFVKADEKPTYNDAIAEGNYYYLQDNIFVLIDDTVTEETYNSLDEVYEYFESYGNSSIAVGQLIKILANCAGGFGNGHELTPNAANGFVFGRKNFLDSYRSIIGGHLCKGKGGKRNQFLFGYALETDKNDKVIVGIANEDIADALFEVGGGSYSGSDLDNPTLVRKSVFWVKRDGIYTSNGKIIEVLRDGTGLGSVVASGGVGYNEAKGQGSLAGGTTNSYNSLNTLVDKDAFNSLGWGYLVRIAQTCCYGFGWGIKLLNDAFKTAVGYYNEDAPGAVFEVGFGANDSNRKNVFQVNKDGTAKFDKLSDGITTKLVSELLKAIMPTDYATTDKAGVVKAGTGFQGIAFSNGTPYIVGASNTEIDAKSSNYKPVTPKNLDYAVKKSITDSGITLTDEEKAKALAWLGMILDKGTSTNANDIVKRYSGGNIFVPSVPSYNGAATSKYYIDNLPMYLTLTEEQKAKWKAWLQDILN